MSEALGSSPGLEFQLPADAPPSRLQIMAQVLGSFATHVGLQAACCLWLAHWEHLGSKPFLSQKKKKKKAKINEKDK